MRSTGIFQNTEFGRPLYFLAYTAAFLEAAETEPGTPALALS